MKLQCPMNNFERYAVFPMTMYQKRKPAKPEFCGLFVVEQIKSRSNPWGSTGIHMVEMRGVEPLSEKKSTLVSPGAVYLQHSLGAKRINTPTLW